MKLNRQAIISGVVMLLLLALFSCRQKDDCDKVECDNGGVCVNGTCSCPLGYEGTDCNQLWSNKFSGTWQADEVYYKDTVHRPFTLQATILNKDSFIVYNFADSYSVLATRAAYRRFTFIPYQRPDSFFTLTEGYGQMDESGTVTGLYSFSMKTVINDTTTKDTLITTKFTWTK